MAWEPWLRANLVYGEADEKAKPADEIPLDNIVPLYPTHGVRDDEGSEADASELPARPAPRAHRGT